jgi:hypothetical protein
MCQTIVINRGERELDSVKDFEEYFNTEIEIPPNPTNADIILKDCCLCQIDIPKELGKMGIEYKYDFVNYYVGDLENVIIDD